MLVRVGLEWGGGVDVGVGVGGTLNRVGVGWGDGVEMGVGVGVLWWGRGDLSIPIEVRGVE